MGKGNARPCLQDEERPNEGIRSLRLGLWLVQSVESRRIGRIMLLRLGRMFWAGSSYIEKPYYYLNVLNANMLEFILRSQYVKFFSL